MRQVAIITVRRRIVPNDFGQARYVRAVSAIAKHREATVVLEGMGEIAIFQPPIPGQVAPVCVFHALEFLGVLQGYCGRGMFGTDDALEICKRRAHSRILEDAYRLGKEAGRVGVPKTKLRELMNLGRRAAGKRRMEIPRAMRDVIDK